MQTKEQLISKLFENRCTQEEKEYLLQLIKEDPSEEGPEVMAELFQQLVQVPEMQKGISERIYEQVEKSIAETDRKPALRKKLYWRVGSAAAAVLVLIGSIWVLQYQWANKIVRQQSVYGEVKEFYLPDSSLVVLNGNSSVSYNKKWQSGETRVVRLEGEAYFKVRKKPATQTKFQVVTNDLTVEVLGTAFNVNTHKNQTRVFLEEGKVKVNLDHELDQVVQLAPGEAMRYSAINQKLTPPEKVIEELQPNWRTGILQFMDTPLQLIMEELSQAHRLKFMIADSALAETPFTISLPTEDMDQTMSVLGRSIGSSITKENDRYLIGTE